MGARACALAGVCVRSCVRAYVRTCVRAYVRTYVRACGGLAPVSRTGRTAPCGVVIMIIPNLIRLACILLTTSKEPVCPRVELILKIIIILLIIFLGFIKSKPC